MKGIYSTILDTFDEVDFQNMRFPLIVVYENPKDFPGKVVARIFDVNQPTPFCVVRNELDEIRKLIPVFMYHSKRHQDDDPVIAEVYY